MATAKQAVSFDDIINADRQRRKNEALANEIFRKSGRSNETARDGNKKSNQVASLASRIEKRSSSSTNVRSPRTNSFHQPKPPSRPSSAAAQIARNNRIASAVNSQQQANILTPSQPRIAAPGPGLSIRGTAGPFVVHASNFAPGTTAADIESALTQVIADDTGTIPISSCRIMSNNPTVIAEMVFSEKFVADKVVNTFNNQKADGRILHVYMKASGPGATMVRKKSEPTITAPDPLPATSSEELFGQDTETTDDFDMEMTTESNYHDVRQEADQSRRERESKRAELDILDGRYGFENKDERNDTESHVVPLQPREEIGESRTDDRDGGIRRDEDRDRRYDGGYPRRDDGGYRRDDRYDEYRRDGRPSHYGNSVGRGYGNGDRYGRMYSDRMVGDRLQRRGNRGYR